MFPDIKRTSNTRVGQSRVDPRLYVLHPHAPISVVETGTRQVQELCSLHPSPTTAAVRAWINGG